MAQPRKYAQGGVIKGGEAVAPATGEPTTQPATDSPEVIDMDRGITIADNMPAVELGPSLVEQTGADRRAVAAFRAGVDQVATEQGWTDQPEVGPEGEPDRVVVAAERFAHTLLAKANKVGASLEDRRIAAAARELANAIAWDRA